MKSNRVSTKLPLVESGIIFNDPVTKSNKLDDNFSSKASLLGADNSAPNLATKDSVCEKLSMINS